MPITADDIAARIDRLPATRAVWKLAALLSLGYFFEFYDLLYTAYVAPGLVRSGVLTATAPGLFGTSGVAGFVAALFAGLFVGTLAGGFLADRFGRRPLFTWSLVWYAVANACMAWQDSANGLNFWRGMAGIGLGAELITIAAYLSEWMPAGMRGRAFACGQAAGFVAVPVVAFLAWWLVPLQPFGIDGWRWVVLAGCVGAVAIWWIRRALPESPRWLARHGDIDRADELVRNLEQQVARECGHALPVPQAVRHGSLTDTTMRMLWRAPHRGRVGLMVVFNIFQTIGYYGFASWVPTLLISQGLTVTTSLLYSALIALAAPCGPLLGLLIADRWERKHVIVGAALAMLAAGLLFSQTRAMVAVIGLGVCLTVASNILSYTYHAYQAELFPTAVRGRAVSLVYSAGRLAAICNAFLIGATLHAFGSTGVFVLIAAAMLIVALLIGLFGPRTAGRDVDAV